VNFQSLGTESKSKFFYDLSRDKNDFFGKFLENQLFLENQPEANFFHEITGISMVELGELDIKI